MVYSDGQVLYAGSINDLYTNTFNKFGNAQSGTVTVSVDTTISGSCCYANLTIDETKTLTIINSPGLILVDGSLINNGTIKMYGQGICGGTAGGLGTGNGANGNPGSGGDTLIVYAGSGGAGGVGVGGTYTGGAGGSGGFINSLYFGMPRLIPSNGNSNRFAGGGGAGGNGGSNGANNSAAGGIGGSGAGNLFIYAKHFLNSGTICLLGASGANGAAGTLANQGGAGGGGGGAGGLILINCNTYANVGDIYSSGGTYGLGARGSGTGVSGTDGQVGYEGTVWVMENGSWIA